MYTARRPAQDTPARDTATNRYRLGGQRGAVPVQVGQVVVVEQRPFQPLHRADEQQPPGHRTAVGVDDVNLHVVAPGPAPADGRYSRHGAIRQQPGQCLTDERFDPISRPRWWNGRWSLLSASIIARSEPMRTSSTGLAAR